MDRRLGVTILAIVTAVVIGYGAFQVGLSQGAAVAVQGGTAAAEAVRYGAHWGPGFGFFGLLFPLLFIFLIFALIRAAFGGPRWGSPGGWSGGPRTMFEEWHRDAHTDRPRTDSGNATRA